MRQPWLAAGDWKAEGTTDRPRTTLLAQILWLAFLSVFLAPFNYFEASLMADTSIDAGRINVDTDPKTKTVILKGSVPTDIQKAAAEKLAISKATGYWVVNQLVVAPENK